MFILYGTLRCTNLAIAARLNGRAARGKVQGVDGGYCGQGVYLKLGSANHHRSVSTTYFCLVVRGMSSSFAVGASAPDESLIMDLSTMISSCLTVTAIARRYVYTCVYLHGVHNLQSRLSYQVTRSSMPWLVFTDLPARVQIQISSAYTIGGVQYAIRFI